MFCPKCGAEMEDSAASCPSCNASVSEVEKDMKQRNAAQYKEAKAAYKQAKKAAGKSNAPLVIIIVVVAVLLLGAAAGGTWWYKGQEVKDGKSEIAKLQEANDALTKELEETKAKLAKYEGAEAELEAIAKAMVGTWKVDSFDTTTKNYACYGGKKSADKVSVTISRNDQTGELTAELSFLYHGHARPQKADSQGEDTDAVVVKQQLTGKLTENGLVFTLDMSKDYGANSKAVITLKMGDADSETMSLVVESYFKTTSDSITDTFSLVKA